MHQDRLLSRAVQKKIGASPNQKLSVVDFQKSLNGEFEIHYKLEDNEELTGSDCRITTWQEIDPSFNRMETLASDPVCLYSKWE
jgi:hypothetical protein